MPLGRTHDRITLWSLPFIVGFTLGATRSGNLTLLVAGAFLFSGLMFGPDLDTRSRQYKRWGWLRWLWLPYQKSLRHRATWTHGFLIGTLLRVAYLMGCIALMGVASLTLWAIAYQYFVGTQYWQVLLQQQLARITQTYLNTLQQYPLEAIALLVGLEMGAMSHSLSDWLASTYKHLKKNKPHANKPYPKILPPSPIAAPRVRRLSPHKFLALPPASRNLKPTPVPSPLTAYSSQGG
ncbi:metal-binding protein [Trichothermofontia sp.]